MGPNIICVGAQKSGTTWLYHQLVLHPLISAPVEKELNYFSNKCSSYTHNFFDSYSNGYSWYLEQLNQESGKLCCDFSPNYLWDSRAALRIREHSPDSKIIIILREPVSRAFSQYSHAKKTFDIGGNFEDALINHPDILQRSYYFDDVARYFGLFPRSSIKVLFYENLKLSPVQFLKDVYSFIGIDPYIADSHDERVNQALYPKYIFVNSLISRIYSLKGTKFGKLVWGNNRVRKIGNGVIKKIKKLNLQEFPTESLTDAHMVKFAHLFADDKARLEALLETRLPW